MRDTCGEQKGFPNDRRENDMATKARRIYDATMLSIRSLANYGGRYQSLDYIATIDEANMETEGERDCWIYRRTLNEMHRIYERDVRHYKTECKTFGGDPEWADYLTMRAHALRIMCNSLVSAERNYVELDFIS